MNLRIGHKGKTFVLVLSIFFVQTILSQTFLHPGILHTEDDFTRIRNKIAQNAEPWASAYKIFSTDPSSARNYSLRGPAESVQRDASLGYWNYTIFIRDADAAYNNAVMWKLTGDTAYAKNSVMIMNAWSYTLKLIYGSDAQLGAGQIGFRWANAAEIIRYSYNGWAQNDILQFETMLKTVFVPIINMYADANWGGGCIKGMMSIGIFCNDTAIYNSALNAFYSNPCTSLSKNISPSGQNSESGRDQVHGQINIGHMAEVAWVAQNQGLDLFGALNNRILTGFEYTAKYMLGNDDVPWDVSVHRCTMGPWSSITAVNRSLSEMLPMYEMVYNYYVKRKGLDAPFTTMAAATTRIENKSAGSYDGEHLTGWGTLMFTLDEGIRPNNQTIISFPTIRKKMGDADFDPGAAASSGLPITYRSSDATIATIVNNKVHIVIAGTVIITAYQTGNSSYNPAVGVSQTMSLVFNPYVKFEAENYSTQSGITTMTANDDTESMAISSQNGSSNIVYTGAILGTTGPSLMYFRYSSTSDTAVNLTIRMNAVNGPKIGMVVLSPTGGDQVWKTDSCALSGPVGTKDIWIDFGGKVNLNWLLLDSIKTFNADPVSIPVLRLEAEDYSDKGGSVDWAGTSIGNIKSVGWISIKNVNLNGLTKIEAWAASNSGAGSTISKNIEVRLDALTGPVVATLVVPKTGSWWNYTSVIANVSGLSGKHNLYFKFTISGGNYTSYLYNIDWFQLYYNTQTINFPSMPAKYSNDADFDPVATSSSLLDVSYISSNPDIASIIGNKIHINHVGIDTIKAYQPGNSAFSAATPVFQVLNVAVLPVPGIPTGLTVTAGETFDTLNWTANTQALNYNVKQATFNGGPYTTIASGVNATNYIDTGLNYGTTYYYVVSALNSSGESINSAEVPLFIARRSQTITFDTFNSLPQKTVGDTDFIPGANASSGLTIIYTSSNDSVASIISGKIHIIAAGNASITASQPGNTSYSPAIAITQLLTVVKKEQTINFAEIATKTMGDSSFDPGAIASSGLPIIYTSSNDSVATIVNEKVTLLAVGTAVITANQSGDSTYNSMSSTRVLTVIYKSQAITFNAITAKRAGDPDFDVVAVASSGLPVNFASSNENIAVVTNGVIHILGIGSTILTANQAGNVMYQSATFNQTLTVLPFNLKMQHLDGDNGQVGNSTIKPYLKIVNDDSVVVAYSELTARYWLTAENFTGINTWIDYAQLGANVKMKYVALAIPRNGALGYVEYSFLAAAGNLAAVSNSGVIQSRLGNTDWSNLDETDDYSYVNNQMYTANSHITLYRNGQLVWGVEPLVSAQVINLKAYTEAGNNGKNTISTYLKINNEGNVPVAYGDISVRYWFTAEGTASLNYWVDYAKLGSSNINGQFMRVSPALTSADVYFEVKVNPNLGTFYPLSSTGNIQYRIAKSDWSNFVQANNYSYLPVNSFSENNHITVYYKEQLIYGTEPSGNVKVLGITNKTLESEQTEDNKSAIGLYPNPLINKLTISIGKIEKEAMVQVYTANGVLIFSHGLVTEVSTLSAQRWTPGIYYVRIKNGDIITVKKVVKE